MIPKSRRILIVGTVRNVGKTLADDISVIDAAFSEEWSKSFFFVESDSTDNSREELERIQQKYSNVSFLSLGDLQTLLPDRIERIRYCRQEYVKKIRETLKQEKWDFVLVCDLDGINNVLKPESIDSCFKTSVSWDACFPVQTHGYYDLFALRHSVWMPYNIFTQVKSLEASAASKFEQNPKPLDFLRKYLEIDKIKRDHFYSKMLRLQKRPEWIPVKSAFGGLGLYKAEIFLKHDYTFLSLEEETYSEHIDLHFSMVSSGLRLYINPKFINSSWNSYNLNRHFIFRLYRRLGLRLRS